MLTGPHQILSVDVSSSTIRLSLGDRPVFFPEDVAIAPAEVMADPVSLLDQYVSRSRLDRLLLDKGIFVQRRY